MRNTGLHWAVKRNHFELACDLIHKQSYLNAENLLGKTPLHYAILN